MPAVPTEHLDRKGQPQIPMTLHTVIVQEVIERKKIILAMYQIFYQIDSMYVYKLT